MAVKDNWASRRHQDRGSAESVNVHKAIASGFVLPKPERKTDVPGLPGPGTGGVGTPGWFSTKK